MAKVKIIYIDCTSTYISGLNTGIQRVVRSLVRYGLERYSESIEFKVRPVIVMNGRYYLVGTDSILQTGSLTTSFGQRVRHKFHALQRWVLKRTPKGMPSLVSVYLFFAAEKVLKIFYSAIKFVRLVMTAVRHRTPKVHIGSNDVLVLADAFWTYDFYTAVQAQTDVSSTRVFSVIYDLIPFSHPECFEDIIGIYFKRHLPRLLQVTDHCISISQFVTSELQRVIKENNYKNVPCTAFTLGSDFSIKKHTQVVQPEVRLEIQNAFGDSQTPAWLVVSTIEPRKNHGFILDAFELLWSLGKNDHLVIIGRTGWKCESFLARLEMHPYYGTRLFHFWDISDAELQHSYQSAHGLIFASIVEGFGLPLVEAMNSNVPIVCSDIPVFREVAGDYPRYFKLSHPQELANALLAPIDKKSSVTTSQHSLKIWKQSADEFFDIIEKHLIS